MIPSHDLDVPPLALGIVPYLNVQPMAYGLSQAYPQLRIVHAAPSALDPMLGRGQIDIGTLPIISAFLSPDRSLYSAPVIASDGPVYSVLIVSKRPLREIRRVQRDPHSLTSNALAAILLREYWHSEATLAGNALDSGECQAAVIIGDPAIRAHGHWPHIHDLGQAWRAWTGLPFVFAAWIGRAQCRIGDFGQALERHVRRNRDRLEDVILSHNALADVSLATRMAYLRENLSFALGERERRAVALFHQECIAHRLVPEHPLRWDSQPMEQP